MAMGVDSFKTDFGERIPFQYVKYHDGSDPIRMHNYYSYAYNKLVWDTMESVAGKGQGCLFARAGAAGSQQFPVHWGGDCESTFEAMAESLRGGLSLSLSGFGFWAHDIGGFEGTRKLNHPSKLLVLHLSPSPFPSPALFPTIPFLSHDTPTDQPPSFHLQPPPPSTNAGSNSAFSLPTPASTAPPPTASPGSTAKIPPPSSAQPSNSKSP